MPREATWRSTISARWCASSRSLSSFRGGELAKDLLERLEPCDRFVVGEIEVERRDGDESALDCFEVRSFAGMPDRRFSADPVVLSSPGVFPFDDSLGVDAFAEPRDPHAVEFGDREIHVQDDAGIAVLLQRDAGQLAGEGRAAVEREVLADERGEGDRRDVQERPLEGGRDRARVRYVIA